MLPSTLLHLTVSSLTFMIESVLLYESVNAAHQTHVFGSRSGLKTCGKAYLSSPFISSYVLSVKYSVRSGLVRKIPLESNSSS